jgi:hypothetical protein
VYLCEGQAIKYIVYLYSMCQGVGVVLFLQWLIWRIPEVDVMVCLVQTWVFGLVRYANSSTNVVVVLVK